MPDDFFPLARYFARLGYPLDECLRRAFDCLDDSQPAPGWTHKEQQ